jgi:ABC-2 type transport system permease protein
LAVAIRGSFDSFFRERGSPFQATAALTETAEAPLGTIESSPDSSRLIVIGSAEFVDDAVLQISSRLSADRYLNNLQFVQNAVDWAVEDQDLLTIRSRGTSAHLLKPLEKGEQSFWEILNYSVALVALVAIAGVQRLRRRSEQPMFDVDSSTIDGVPVSNSEPRATSSEGGSDE